jgi:hypothetical protein
MHGRSMPLAKCILSHNVRRVRVCKRHLLPARDRKVPDAAGDLILWRPLMFLWWFHIIHLF